MNSIIEWPLRSTLSALAVALLLCAGPVHAQQKQLSRATYEKLNEIRDLIDEDRHREAITRLEQLLTSIGSREYERAVTLQTLGYARIGRDDERGAIDAFERALALEALPDSPTLRLHNMLARLHARTGQYAKAREYLDAWFAEIEQPGADDHALKANILVELEEYAAGIEAIRQAIAMAERPREQYHQVLVALLFGAERYTEAASALQDVLALWPQKAQYWTQLASVYLNLERNEDAHAVLQLAYRKGLLETESELLQLARVGLSIDLPAAAGELIEEEIAAGRVDGNEDNWELAGHAWAVAKEWDRAIDAYANAAEYGDAGKYHMRRAHMFTYQDDWAGAIGAARAALADEDFDSPGEAHILIGRGHLELDQHEQAMAAFEAARDYDDTADQARQWRRYVERQQEYNGSATAS